MEPPHVGEAQHRHRRPLDPVRREALLDDQDHLAGRPPRARIHLVGGHRVGGRRIHGREPRPLPLAGRRHPLRQAVGHVGIVFLAGRLEDRAGDAAEHGSEAPAGAGLRPARRLVGDPVQHVGQAARLDGGLLRIAGGQVVEGSVVVDQEALDVTRTIGADPVVGEQRERLVGEAAGVALLGQEGRGLQSVAAGPGLTGVVSGEPPELQPQELVADPGGGVAQGPQGLLVPPRGQGPAQVPLVVRQPPAGSDPGEQAGAPGRRRRQEQEQRGAADARSHS